MFDQTHYFPILKWKGGEQSALSKLDPSIKEGLTPFVEIPPIEWDYENEQPKKTIDEHLEGIEQSFEKVWGLDRYFYLDMLWIDPDERMQNGEHPLAYILNKARIQGIKIVPVTGTDRDDAYQQEIINAISKDNLGVCFRLTDNDFEDIDSSIKNLQSLFNLTPSQVDLLIDYKYVNPKNRNRTYLFLSGLLNNIPQCSDWRNIILSGTAMPKDLSGLKTNDISEIERTEWVIWKKLMSISDNIQRMPLFGDYVIANPDPFDADPRKIKPSANIRYTAENNFIIFKGANLKRYGYSQYFNLAKQAVKHPKFKGEHYSNGDKFISEVSKNLAGPGNLTTWREVGTNHHLTFTVNELANLSYSSISF